MESTRRLPRRVLHVLCGAAGGATTSTIELVAALSRAGIESCAVCHPAGTLAERKTVAEAFGGRVEFLSLYFWNRKIRVDLWKRPLIELAQAGMTGCARLSALRVARIARAARVQLIHTNTFLNPEGGIAARLLGVPHVWHLRELIGAENPFRFPRRGASLRRFLQTHASFVVANSHASAGALRAEIGAFSNIETVPNGIDFSAIERESPRAAGEASLVVAMVANLTSRSKKHDLFVDAARALAGANSRVQFRIYGHDPGPSDAYASSLHTRAGGAVSFMGFVPTRRIVEEIDVLVHPADNESFGRTVAEAMGVGIPIVGARGGGVAELVRDGETGLLFRPDSVEDLTVAIEQLMAQPALRARLGAAGRSRARELYSIDGCAQSIARVYADAMTRPLGSGSSASRDGSQRATRQ